MSLAKGIKVQPSRFSALNIDSDSDSEVSGGEWLEVAGKGSKSKGKDGAAQAQHREAVSGNRPLSKSAKKRARKKRNQQSSSSESKGAGGEEQGGVERGEGLGSEEQAQLWQEREAEAVDLEFHRELEEAILQSKVSAEKEQEIEKQRKAAFALNKQSKKGVKLSLQSLHRGDLISDSENLKSPQVSETVNDDSAFFERLGHDVELEMKKQPERRVSESQMSPVEESARVAHAMDKLEKRDKTIASLRTENKALMDQMKEVKGRNQKLCKILGQGEFSTKTQLLEHIEELTTVKNEMTAEVERLHSLLEQERSRNKSLQAELTKHTSKAGKPRHN